MPCAICDRTLSCFKCQIKTLKEKLALQDVELRYWKGESCKLLSLKKDYRQFFEISMQYLPLSYIGNSIDYKFLTITFDPKKFGQFNLHSDEQNYIFKQLYKLIKAKLITSLAGCFELQKNGTTHAHLICRTTVSNEEINTALRLAFTDDPKNKCAIRCEDPKNMENVTNYLKKESNDFYRYDLTGALDYEPQAYEQPISEEKPKHSHLQSTILYLEKEIISHRKALEKYYKILNNNSYTDSERKSEAST